MAAARELLLGLLYPRSGSDSNSTANAFEQTLIKCCVPALKKNKNWDFVFRHINRNKASIVCRKLLGVVCKFLLDSLLQYECNDLKVMLRIVEACEIYLTDDPDFIFDESDGGYFGGCGCEHHPRFIEVKKQTLKPLRTFQKRRGANIMHVAIENADVKLATVVAKYGTGQIFCIPPCSCLLAGCEYMVVSMILEKIQYFVPSSDTSFSGRWSFNTELMKQMMDSGGKLTGEAKRGFRRIYLMSLIFNAISFKLHEEHESTDKAENCVQCIRLFFNTHSEPFVSRGEFREFLLYVTKAEEDNDVLNKMVDIFADFFDPESDVIFCPRPLKDLCRYNIRKGLLKESTILPDLVRVLPVPDPLKVFLLGVTESHS